MKLCQKIRTQSGNTKILKFQFGTLGEPAVLELIFKNLSIKQKELVTETDKSFSIIKRIMESLQEKEYILRVDEKRYGKWEVLVSNQNGLIF